MSSGWLSTESASPPVEQRKTVAASGSQHVNNVSPAPARYSPLPSTIVSRVRRPPLERAASVPEQGSTRPVPLNSAGSRTSVGGRAAPPDYNTVIKAKTVGSGGRIDGLGCVRESVVKSDSDGSSLNEVFHNGAGSRGSSHGSLDRILYLRQHNKPRLSLDRGIPKPPSHLHLMPMDENNIPQIDAAITPPCSPVKGQTMINSAGIKGFKRKLPSLKFKRGRMGSGGKDSASSPPSSAIPINPTITITMNDGVVTEDEHFSDYLSPDKNYKTPPTSAIPGSDNASFGPSVAKEHRSVHSQFIGDDVSLYGTPKEELSPLKEVETQCGTGLLSNNNKGPPSISPTNYLKDQIISFFQPSDNKLAMKLFGNKNALMKEKMRQKAAGNWVIHPCSNFR